MTMPTLPVVLPLNCHRCGGSVGVSCQVDADPSAQQTVRFSCPYCELVREFSAPGRVLRIATMAQSEGATVH